MSNTGSSRIRLVIRGTVQGVWFRESTRQEAERLGVVGWVRNLPDGTVESVAEAAPEVLQEFIRWCHKGPSAARVLGVEERAEPATGEFVDFRVLR